MYGDAKVTEHANEAKAWMQQITENVEVWQRRAQLGLEQLRARPEVDSERLAAIGYCFGGATVLQMAYAGMDLKGVVSFHGSLPTPGDDAANPIEARVLVAHGDADQFVSAERISAFKDALNKAGVDWEMDIYGGARHSFTVPDAERKGIDNLKYDPLADTRSWQRLLGFFHEIF
jgi:dienelactone hydrolase